MWDWAVWGALAIAICSGIVGIALVFARVRDAFRIGKRVGSRAVSGLGDLATKGELAATKAEATGDTRELHESVARLRRSLAQLAVIRAAIADLEEKLAWPSALL